MSRVVELLDEAKEKLGVDTDYKLAKELDLHNGLIADYRKGKRIPDAYASTKIAVVLGLEPMDLIAEMELLSAKSEKARGFWRDFLRQHGKAAGATMALVCIVSFGTVGELGKAQASETNLTINGHYAKCWRETKSLIMRLSGIVLLAYALRGIFYRWLEKLRFSADALRLSGQFSDRQKTLPAR